MKNWLVGDPYGNLLSGVDLVTLAKQADTQLRHQAGEYRMPHGGQNLTSFQGYQGEDGQRAGKACARPQTADNCQTSPGRRNQPHTAGPAHPGKIIRRVFEGWVEGRKIRITYQGLAADQAYEHLFATYLIGESSRFKDISVTAPARRFAQSEQQLASLQSELEAVQASTGGGFEHQERLDFLKQRVKALNDEVQMEGD